MIGETKIARPCLVLCDNLEKVYAVGLNVFGQVPVNVVEWHRGDDLQASRQLQQSMHETSLVKRRGPHFEEDQP